MDISVDLLQWLLYGKLFDKKTSEGGIKNENMTDQQKSRRILQTNFRKFNKRKVQLPFIDKIWCADLVDMQWINKFNK